MRSCGRRRVHAVGGRPIPTGGESVEHVADVADERSGIGRDRDPTVGGANFESAGIVLPQHGEESVVGVFADAVVGRVRRVRRVAEQPEEDDRIREPPVAQRRGFEAESDRDRPGEVLAESLERAEILASRWRAARRVRSGHTFGPWSGSPASTRRSVARELAPEVVPLFVVGRTRRQLAVEREPAAPRGASVHHRDAFLLRFGSGEELAGQRVEAFDQSEIDAVVDDGEEPDVATRLIDLAPRRLRRRFPRSGARHR